jgi:hypothetical protein
MEVLVRMFAALPLISWLGLFLVIHESGQEWRSSVLIASVCWGVILVLATEVLSPFGLLTFPWVAALWAVVAVALAVVYGRIRRPRPSQPVRVVALTNIDAWSRSMLWAVILLLVTIGLIALIAPPNTNDSMSYHMSRVVHWEQNHSISHYPTHILRQLVLPPGAELAILHLQILSGGDRFANLVQWFSVAAGLCGVSLIAEELGADVRGQILSVVVCATLPMAILQASSTQNDAVVAFWLIALVYFLLVMRRREEWFYPYVAGMSLGLALVTKATAYLLAPPFLIWFGVHLLRTMRRRAWKPVLIVAVSALGLNLGHYARNIRSFGHPLNPGPVDLFDNLNETTSASAMFSNALRDIALHGVVPSDRITAAVQSVVSAVHGYLNIDVDDPRTTLGDTPKFQLLGLSPLHEDTVGNPLHLILIVACTIALLVLWRDRKWRAVAIYSLCVPVGLLLIASYLKWAPWIARYHLPSFMLWSPVVGLMLATFLNRKANVVAVVLLVAAIPWVLLNQTRPLLGQYGPRGVINTDKSIVNMDRAAGYFINFPESEEDYRGAAEFVRARGCSQIGLDMRSNDFEYQLWPMLKSKADENVRIEHVNTPDYVHALSRRFLDFRPCAIIAFGGSGEKTRIVNGSETYDRAWQTPLVGVFVHPGD